MERQSLREQLIQTTVDIELLTKSIIDEVIATKEQRSGESLITIVQLFIDKQSQLCTLLDQGDHFSGRDHPGSKIPNLGPVSNICSFQFLNIKNVSRLLMSWRNRSLLEMITLKLSKLALKMPKLSWYGVIYP